MSSDVAIVHDYLVERGGAERVALSLLRTFPGATLYTGLYRPEDTYPGFADHHVVELLKSRMFPGDHRASLPLALLAFRRLEVDADVLVCSSSGLSHLANTSSGKTLIYCHTPARWAHDPSQYFLEASRLRRVVGAAAVRFFHPLDRQRMVDADVVLANSRTTSSAMMQLYGLKVPVVHPESSLHVEGDHEPLDVPAGFFLTTSRLLGYKRVDVLLEAASHLADQSFLIVGDGPIRHQLERSAPENVRFTGAISDAQLRWAYAKSRAVVLTCAEDFGLVPGEAAAFGKISVVPNSRGLGEQALERGGIRTYPYGDAVSLAQELRAVLRAPNDASDETSRHEGQALFRRTLRRAVANATHATHATHE